MLHVAEALQRQPQQRRAVARGRAGLLRLWLLLLVVCVFIYKDSGELGGLAITGTVMTITHIEVGG